MWLNSAIGNDQKIITFHLPDSKCTTPQRSRRALISKQVGTQKVRQQQQKYKISRQRCVNFTGAKTQLEQDERATTATKTGAWIGDGVETMRRRCNESGAWQLITKEGIQDSYRQEQRKTQHEQTELEKHGNSIAWHDNSGPSMFNQSPCDQNRPLGNHPSLPFASHTSSNDDEAYSTRGCEQLREWRSVFNWRWCS